MMGKFYFLSFLLIPILLLVSSLPMIMNFPIGMVIGYPFTLLVSLFLWRETFLKNFIFVTLNCGLFFCVFSLSLQASEYEYKQHITIPYYVMLLGSIGALGFLLILKFLLFRSFPSYLIFIGTILGSIVFFKAENKELFFYGEIGEFLWMTIISMLISIASYIEMKNSPQEHVLN